MQELAADYLEHFTVDIGEEIRVGLDDSAPQDLLDLDRLVRDMFGPDRQVCLYEALSTAAESEFPPCAEVDEKVCPLDLYFVVVDYLGNRVSSP
jgi:hypothetical protein